MSGRTARRFLSTPSARRATPQGFSTYSSPRFLSTPSARRATWQGGCDYDLQLISIHALREEGDFLLQRLDHFIKISIHALREEGDGGADGVQFVSLVFLSTPSARRATESVARRSGQCRFLSTPSARRATTSSPGRTPVDTEFLSTPSARRATHGCCCPESRCG